MAVVVGALGLLIPALAVADPRATITATCCSGTDNGFDVTVTNISTAGETFNDLNFVLNGSGVKVTNVTVAPSAGYGSSNNDSTGSVIFSPPLGPNQSVTFHVTTSPAGYTGTFNATIDVQGGGMIQLTNIPVTIATSGGPGPGTPPPSTCEGHPAFPEPPGCADLSVADATIGVFFTDPDELPRWLARRNHMDAGLLPVSEWHPGETLNVDVFIRNDGPDATVATPHLISSSPTKEIKLLGWYEPDEDGLPATPVQPGSTFQLAADKSVGFVYAVVLENNPGPVTFTANVTGSIPDPYESNNQAAEGITVLPRPSVSGFEYKAQGEGGAIVEQGRGQAADPGGFAASASPQLEIAVVEKRGAKCSWLKGHSGRFTPLSASSCENPRFLRLPRNGVYRLQHRPSRGGTALVLVRQAGQGDAAELEFAKHLDDLFEIKLN